MMGIVCHFKQEACFQGLGALTGKSTKEGGTVHAPRLLPVASGVEENWSGCSSIQLISLEIQCL